MIRIMCVWPLVLVFLGVEVIAYVRNKDGQMRYDAGSVVLIVVLMIFTISMVTVQMAIENGVWF